MKKIARNTSRVVTHHHSGIADATIIVLHDHSPVRSMFTCLVEWMGYRVQEVHDIQSALSLFDNGDRILAVVCAFHLPDGNAWDFMKDLRGKGIATPFLVVCGRSLEPDMEDDGFEFLPMPLRKEVFDQTIRRIIRQRKTEASRPD